MSYLLQIEVSPSGENSVSRAITADYINAVKAAKPNLEIRTKDFSTEPVPHLDGEAIFAGYTPEDQRSASAATKWNYRLGLIKEITEADEIVISTPMWNWTIPSVLKAYFDQIIIPGVLDGSGADGLKGKKITFVVAHGGSYSEGAPRAGWDYQTGYLKLVANALGATDVEVILAELTLAPVVPAMNELIPAMEASIAAAKAKAVARANA
jgi:FMN-dependent NADH-azoreductase